MTSEAFIFEAVSFLLQLKSNWHYVFPRDDFSLEEVRAAAIANFRANRQTIRRRGEQEEYYFIHSLCLGAAGVFETAARAKISAFATHLHSRASTSAAVRDFVIHNNISRGAAHIIRSFSGHTKSCQCVVLLGLTSRGLNTSIYIKERIAHQCARFFSGARCVLI
jgi:hypothetical protein